MPKIAEHQSAQTTKGLLLGNPGSGKTGALCSLAHAGYNLRILDYDNGADIIRSLLLDPGSPYSRESADRVEFVTMSEPKRKLPNGRLVPGKAEVWTKTLDMLQDWTDGEIKHGHVDTWSTRDVLVFDSMSALSVGAMRHQLSMNGRLGQRPWESDWGEAQDLVRSLVEMVMDSSIKCNVLFLCHLKAIDVSGIAKNFPNTLGKALPQEIGRYFNTALFVEVSGSGASAKRKISTQPRGIIDLKNTAPFRVKPEYDITHGLAEYFAAVRGEPEGGKKP